MYFNDAKKYRIPHNVMIAEETIFIIKMLSNLKVKKITTSDFQITLLINQIRTGKLKEFHNSYHNELSDMQRDSYKKINNGKYDQIDINNILNNKKGSKTFKSKWNETCRDNIEWLAFCGALTSYFKNDPFEESVHFITPLCVYNTKQDLINLIESFKLRNSSKNIKNFSIYDVEVRTYVVASRVCEALDIIFGYANRGLISYFTLLLKEELSVEEITKLIRGTGITTLNETGLSSIEKKEFKRADKPLFEFLEFAGVIEKINEGKTKNWKFIDNPFNFQHSLFSYGTFMSYEITPLIGNLIMRLKKTDEFNHASFYYGLDLSESEKNKFTSDLIEHGFVENNIVAKIKIPHFNPYTEFSNIKIADDVYNTSSVEGIEYELKIATNTIDKEGIIKASKQSNGQVYEKKLAEEISKVFDNTRHLGTSFSGQRISDIVSNQSVLVDDKNKNILMIFEAKASNAIKSFDERKEKDNIINTCKSIKNFDSKISGVWYIIVASDALKTEGHGGFREDQRRLSLEQKMHDIHKYIVSLTNKEALVTVFSSNDFSNWLQYTFDNKTSDIISKMNVEDFWTWSNKFAKLTYHSKHINTTRSKW